MSNITSYGKNIFDLFKAHDDEVRDMAFSMGSPVGWKFYNDYFLNGQSMKNKIQILRAFRSDFQTFLITTLANKIGHIIISELKSCEYEGVAYTSEVARLTEKLGTKEAEDLYDFFYENIKSPHARLLSYSMLRSADSMSPELEGIVKAILKS